MNAPLTLLKGLPVTEINNYKVVIDTGSPITIGPECSLTIDGTSHHITPSMLDGAIDFENLVPGERIDILMGMDILSCHKFTIDTINNVVNFGSEMTDYDEEFATTTNIGGIISAYISVNNRQENMIIDTGAHIPYLYDRNNLDVTGRGRDWNPELGKFDFDIVNGSVTICDKEESVNFGILPSTYASLLKMTTGTAGIIGYQLYKDKKIFFDIESDTVRIKK